MRAAEDQGRKRVVGTGEAELVEGVEGEVGLFADGDLADVVAAEATRRAFGRPTKASKCVTEAAS